MLPFRFYVSIETNLKRGCRWEFYSPIICKENIVMVQYSPFIYLENIVLMRSSPFIYRENISAQKKIWPVGENDC